MRNAILSALCWLVLGLQRALLSTDAVRAWSERQAAYEWRMRSSPRLQAAYWMTLAAALVLFSFAATR